ncbi:MAG: twin-arginine translocase TatA/TatE family subunit [Chromatiales bacterium]|jgi:sec-independent protein translocase protein TatA|nr:twin-arginine translocase TatA/TatE family subunit [Chromatiales bacterium]
MGLGGVSVWELLIILAIVITIFGAGRLRNVGADLGAAVRSFRQGLRDDDAQAAGDLPSPTAGDPAQR